MDQKLRDEFRAYKIETDDRVKRLEKAVQSISASSATIGAKADETKPATSYEAKSK